MPYMIHQQLISAVQQAYRHDPTAAAAQQRQARQCRQWLENLAIEPRLRNGLVEPVAAIEEALADIHGGPRLERPPKP
ncbi:MAG: hypothetical protein R3300_03960 [Candidatus Promineifilaceae bacterium]|nr:hypothetical protein [Candidatus Promineifilaceae bacterium]